MTLYYTGVLNYNFIDDNGEKIVNNFGYLKNSILNNIDLKNNELLWNEELEWFKDIEEKVEHEI